MKRYVKRFCEYKNATIFKLENKRVSVISDENGAQLQFISKSTTDAINEPRSSHKVIRNKFVKTSINLTNEALIALKLCIDAELNKRDENFFKTHSDMISHIKVKGTEIKN